MMLIQDLHLYVLYTYQLHLFSVTATATYSNNNCDYCKNSWNILTFVVFSFVRGEGGDCTSLRVCTDVSCRLL